MQLLPQDPLRPLRPLPRILRHTALPTFNNHPIRQRLQRIPSSGRDIRAHRCSRLLSGELAVLGGAGVAEDCHLDVGFGEAGGVVGGPAD